MLATRVAVLEQAAPAGTPCAAFPAVEHDSVQGTGLMPGAIRVVTCRDGYETERGADHQTVVCAGGSMGWSDVTAPTTC